jgi:hypothetical protein
MTKYRKAIRPIQYKTRAVNFEFRFFIFRSKFSSNFHLPFRQVTTYFIVMLVEAKASRPLVFESHKCECECLLQLTLNDASMVRGVAVLAFLTIVAEPQIFIRHKDRRIEGGQSSRPD